MASQTFEQVLALAQAEGSLTSAWRKFVATKFFVPLPDASGKPAATVIIAEQRERLGAQGDGAASLSGADIIRHLHPQAGIQVALGSGSFSIAPDKVEWLRKGIEASLARAAAARQAAAEPTPPPSPAPATYPGTPVQRNQRGVLDITALKPRPVEVKKLGLDFFVPGSWTGSAMSGGVRLRDPDGSTVLEASGVHRDLSLAQWQQMRLALVQHERRYLTQDGESYPLDGEGWRSRIKGMATEFTGTFPGDEAPSRYLLACIVIEGTAVSLTIRAGADEFERCRQIYKWLLGRVDIRAEAAIEQAAPFAHQTHQTHQRDDTVAPGVIGNNMEGRIGRMRAMAYSFPLMGLVFLTAGLGALLLKNAPVMAAGFMIFVVVAATYLSIRLMVLRLHDVNMSGKWIAAYVILMMIAGATRNPTMMVVVGGIFWLAMIIIYCFIPGSADDNDYGPPPPPNTVLVQVGAALYILLNVLAVAGGMRAGSQGVDLYNAKVAEQRETRAVAPSNLRIFQPGNAFSVQVPGAPQRMPMPQGFDARIQASHYELDTPTANYHMQYLQYGNAPIDHASVMDKLRAGVLGGDGAQVISDELILVNSHKGREVRVSMAGNRVRAARYVLANGMICVAAIVSTNDAAGLAEIERFLGSFEVP